MGGYDIDSDMPCELALALPGTLVDGTRCPLFESRAERVARAAAAYGAEDVVSRLRVDSSPHLQLAVSHANAINETSFFRDGGLFEVLRKTILPRLIEAGSAARELRIWCAAASTGQEAYSVAMLLCELLPDVAEWDVRILGTDVSSAVVEYARRGLYRRMEVNRGLPVRMLVKYLERSGEVWEVASGLRAMCEFQTANLGAALAAMPRFDVVLLRNVLLFFPATERGTMLQRVHRQMAPHGYLVLGASEQAEDCNGLFQEELAGDCCFYRAL
jgi:chemotaxis protein methyltransferase CheR